MIYGNNKYIFFVLLTITIISFGYNADPEQSSSKELIELFNEPQQIEVQQKSCAVDTHSSKPVVKSCAKNSPVIHNEKHEVAQLKNLAQQPCKTQHHSDTKNKTKACAHPPQQLENATLITGQAKNEKKTTAHKKEVVVFESRERVITVNNNITRDMITYKKHWSGNHTPSKFVISVNDEEMVMGSTKIVKIPEDCDTLNVSFNYEFTALGRVQRAGTKKLVYRIPKDIEQVESTFSWDVPQNLVFDKVELISAIEI